MSLIKKFVLLFAVLVIYAGSGLSAQDTTASALDEFEVFEPVTGTATGVTTGAGALRHEEHNGLARVIFVLAATVFAGVLVRYRRTRPSRAIFLMSSVVVLGFFFGACPCVIQSFQHLFLGLFGVPVRWQGLIYFTALIPITYFFGKVFCGWICHLGALQELVFSRKRIWLQNAAAQKFLRVTRMVVLALLILQLAITQTNLFKTVDPFAAIFNFYSRYEVGWWLVGLLVLSSFLIYRPFCKVLCPVGLVLGWVTKLPGASVLSADEHCISCKKCNEACDIRAITREGKLVTIDNQECIRCGACLDSCVKNSLNVSMGRQQKNGGESAKNLETEMDLVT